ncbi:type II toxin-antitoxin system VapC family toxin [Candidatus Woesearchaeota archaeon]|nr:type II toxin-antitoxin system VapC family toxin [Candidatus Woesearchaeota archaeon]
MKIYVDTNVFIDLIKENSSRRKSERVYEFFKKGWNCAFELIVSDWTRTEICRHVKEEELTLLFNEFKTKNKLYFVTHTKEETQEAKSRNEHWQDELHLMLAKKSGADMIVTYDNDFISYASPIFDIRYPENAFAHREK